MARYDPFAPDFDHPLINSSPDFGSRIGTFRNRAVGDQKSQPTFRERSKRLRSLEDEKNQLIEDLLYQLESMQKEIEQLQYDCTREKQHTLESKFRENSLHDQLRQVKDIMDRDPFIIVLIDGNDMLFTKDLLCKGEKGGIDAADRILKALDGFVIKFLPHLSNSKVVVKIYADVRSLAETMCKLKMIASVTVFEDFVRGFNSTNAFFDFVDTGSSSSSISERLCENLKLHLYDCHCHQIMLGISRNDKLANLLTGSMKDPYILDHVTLLEGAPFEGDLLEIKSKVRSVNFETVFRNIRLENTPMVSSTSIPAPVPAVPVSSPLTRVESNGTSGSISGSVSTSSTPAVTWASMTALPFVPSTSASRSSTTRTSTPSSARTPESTAAKPAVAASIERNRHGQRIDKIDTNVPAHEVQRIKKLKLCNVFYLQGAAQCTASHCAHSHSYPLTKAEKNALREVARMTPCHYKAECDEPECIYGHRCPQGKTSDGSCWYGEDCRFWGWGHGIDTRVVKTTKV